MKVYLKNIVALHQPPKLVIDCGGYKGDYTAEILKRFDCEVIIFEPITEYAKICRQRFGNKVRIIEEAVDEINGYRTIYKAEAGSSFWLEWAKNEIRIIVKTIRLSDFIKEKVDILKLNCEGAEYGVINDLFVHNKLKDIKEILVQFHKIPSFKMMKRKAQTQLNQTHELKYNFKWQLYGLK